MNPLDNLKDIQNPSEIGSWPPAYGWWILALLTILIIYIAIKWAMHFKQQRRAKKQALKEIESLVLEQKNVVPQLNQILKRVALVYFPDISVQSLHGEKWVDFLVSSLSNKHSLTNTEQMTKFQNNLYQNQAVAMSEIIQHKEVVKQWVKLAVPPSKKTTQTLELKYA